MWDSKDCQATQASVPSRAKERERARWLRRGDEENSQEAEKRKCKVCPACRQLSRAMRCLVIALFLVQAPFLMQISLIKR